MDLARKKRSGTAFVLSLFGQGMYVGSGRGRVPVQVQSLVGRKGGMLDGVNQPFVRREMDINHFESKFSLPVL